MKRKVSILTFIFLISTTRQLFACECIGTPSIQDSWNEASQVFVGEVVDIDTSGHLYNVHGAKVVAFQVQILESFKYEIYKDYFYRTFIYVGGGSCDSYFDKGQKYLIYASGKDHDGFLRSSECSRTALLNYVDNSEIEQLKKLYQDFKTEEHLPPISSDGERLIYELALSKSINTELSRDKWNLIILTEVLIAIIILTVLIFLFKRIKRNA